MSLRFRLPLKVNANARGHSRWQPKVRIGALPRMTHRQVSVMFLKPLWQGFSNYGARTAELLKQGLVVTLTRVAPRELDSHDNLRTSLKPIADAVTDLVGLPNDRDPRISWKYAQASDGLRFYAVDVLIEPRPDLGPPCPTCGAQTEVRVQASASGVTHGS